MCVRWHARRISRAFTASVAALVLTGLGPGAAWGSTCRGWTLLKPPSPGTNTFLLSVAATSATNAWAVGSTGTATTASALIEHWNGTTWKQVQESEPGARQRPARCGRHLRHRRLGGRHHQGSAASTP